MKTIKRIFILFFCILVYANCSRPSSNSIDLKTILANDTSFVYLGRIDFTNPLAPQFSYPGTSIKFSTTSSTCNLKLKNISINKDAQGNFYKNYYTVIVDNQKPQTFSVSNGEVRIKLKSLGKGIHTVTLFKRTESLVGEGIFEGVEIDKDALLLPVMEKNTRKIEFIGNSITCGYGNEGKSKDCAFSPETENAYLAYGAITSRRLEADYMAVAYSGKGMYRNYDGSKDETISLIYDRIFPDKVDSPKWNTQQWKPNLVVINVGTNDFAKGIPDSAVFVNTYTNFLKRLRSSYPAATILCILGPMMNDTYPVGEMALNRAKNYIIASSNKLIQAGDSKVYTFFLTPQGEGDYGCDWHPNIAKHEKMANELTKEIKTIMKW